MLFFIVVIIVVVIVTSSGKLEDVVDVNGLNEIVVALEPGVTLVADPGNVMTAVRRATLKLIICNELITF